MEYTYQNLKDDIETCRQQLISLGYNDMKSVKIVCGFMKSMKTLGQTTNNRNDKTRFRIELNVDYVRVANRQDILDTIAHEVCHCVDGCFNHSPVWKAVAKRLGDTYGYVITTHGHVAEWTKYRNEHCKYTLTCQSCGHVNPFQRAGDIVKYFQDHERRGIPNIKYSCGLCHSKQMVLKQNY